MDLNDLEEVQMDDINPSDVRSALKESRLIITPTGVSVNIENRGLSKENVTTIRELFLEKPVDSTKDHQNMKAASSSDVKYVRVLKLEHPYSYADSKNELLVYDKRACSPKIQASPKSREYAIEVGNRPTIHVDSEDGRYMTGTAVVSSTSVHMRPPPPPPPPKPPRGPPQDAARPAEEPSSSIPDLEFDGTTVLCRVCGDKASGFHYGVHSCEGCKGFFRRSIQQKIQYRPCSKNQQCAILRVNRNRCQYCRLKKCIAVGMSRDAVRFGRVPKREKARILAAMQQSSHSRCQQRALAAELDDQPRLLASVLRAHLDTCEFTREKVAAMQSRARESPTYSMPTLACPLNPAPELQSEKEFSQRFAHVIRGVIDFAGLIPGFQLLTQDDKFTLLKAGLFDALFVRLICMFDAGANSIICLNGQVMKRDNIQNGANARFLVDSTFNFAERMNSMCLSDAEVGLFCAIVLITPDRPGLRNVELVERMYSKLKACLQSVIGQNRPGQPEFMHELLQTLPDLRTLSTLHTEKLVVFRTEHKELLRQQMWAMDEDTKSPAGCSWEAMDEVKSPLGSVSSTESVSSADVSPDYHSLTSSAPLLAATLAGGCPRLRANSGSSGEEEFAGAAHLQQNGLTITPVLRAPVTHTRYRKLDSPTDSGIESGNEKHDKQHSSGSSSCSSPRSSLDDHMEDKRHPVEDMPVLKRVLQAPPLYDTNSLMDEAYKPHKKFRAMRQKDSAEAEPAVTVVAPPQSQLHLHLTRPQGTSLSSTHSVLAKSLMEGPRMTPEQMKRSDILNNYIMRGDNQAYKNASNLLVPASTPGCPYSQGRWPQFNGTSVITTTSRQATPSPPVPAPPAVYFQSPHSTISPSPLRHHSPAPPSPSNHVIIGASRHPTLVELQVDIADSQQPLNLSKKSPSPSPPPRAAFTHAGHKLLLEA